ncbi:hypothetical protein L2E82_52158 [Cichorium intybus]|nr:hypothetical protein L2E82_52158 [Cichorium intybus]
MNVLASSSFTIIPAHGTVHNRFICFLSRFRLGSKGRWKRKDHTEKAGIGVLPGDDSLVDCNYTRESDAAYSALPQKGAAFFPPKMPVPPSGPSKHHNYVPRLRFIPATVVYGSKLSLSISFSI